MLVNGKEIRIVSNRDPTKLPWKEMVRPQPRMSRQDRSDLLDKTSMRS